MTTPISSSNSSVYDPSAQMSFADGSGPVASSAGTTAPAVPSSPPVVTIDPVVIEGDAGARQLLQRYEESRRADCSFQGKEAALSCAKAGVVAVAGGLSATTVVGALPAAAATLVESISCGKDLATYLECKSR